MKYLLVTGNVAEGFTFYGPFESPSDANNVADTFDLDDWCVCRLWPTPDNDEEEGPTT